MSTLITNWPQDKEGAELGDGGQLGLWQHWPWPQLSIKGYNLFLFIEM